VREYETLDEVASGPPPVERVTQPRQVPRLAAEVWMKT
jgi:hypothetical protein